MDKNVIVPDGVSIGLDHEADAKAGFTVTEDGNCLEWCTALCATTPLASS